MYNIEYEKKNRERIGKVETKRRAEADADLWSEAGG